MRLLQFGVATQLLGASALRITEKSCSGQKDGGLPEAKRATHVASYAASHARTQEKPVNQSARPELFEFHNTLNAFQLIIGMPFGICAIIYLLKCGLGGVADTLLGNNVSHDNQKGMCYTYLQPACTAGIFGYLVSLIFRGHWMVQAITATVLFVIFTIVGSTLSGNTNPGALLHTTAAPSFIYILTFMILLSYVNQPHKIRRGAPPPGYGPPPPGYGPPPPGYGPPPPPPKGFLEVQPPVGDAIIAGETV